MIRAARLEPAFLLFLLAVFFVGGYLALGLSGQARWLPLGSSLPGALLVAWCLVGFFRASAERAGEPGSGQSPSSGFKHLMITLAIALPVAAVGGFLYAVPVCYLTFGLLSQGRDKLGLAILISLISLAVTYVLFGRLLGVPLTRSIF